VEESRRWFIDFATEYAYFYGLSVNNNKHQIKLEVLQQWSDFIARAADSVFCRMDEDITDLRSKQLKDNQKESSHTPGTSSFSHWDPRKVWNLYIRSAPVLSHAAIALLSVAGSEAAVERTFSAQDATHTAKRNRLLDATVENEMFIKFNRQALEKNDNTAQRHYVNISDDYVANNDSGGSVSNLFTSLLPENCGVDENKVAGDSDDAIPHSEAVVIQVQGPSPPSDPVDRFIANYIASHNITSLYKWNTDKKNELEYAALNNNPSIKLLAEELKKRIMAVVSSTPACATMEIDVSQQ
jgi:hypothetical protein